MVDFGACRKPVETLRPALARLWPGAYRCVGNVGRRPRDHAVRAARSAPGRARPHDCVARSPRPARVRLPGVQSKPGREPRRADRHVVALGSACESGGRARRVLSKLRRVLGPGALEGRREVVLGLPAGATIDLELAEAAILQADNALGAGDARLALGQPDGRASCSPGSSCRDTRASGYSAAAARLKSFGFAGSNYSPGRAWSSPVVSLEPPGGRPRADRRRAATRARLPAPDGSAGRPRGDRRGAAGLQQLRVRLRDELGITPGAAIRAMHERLLMGGEASGAPAPARPAAEAPASDASASDAPASEAGADGQLEAPRRPEREERKVITVLAAELASVTGDSDPEDLRATTTQAHERLYVELERFGATIEASTEGDVVALFGATISHEDDAERAVRAAVGLRDAGLVVAPASPPAKSSSP